MSHLPTAQHDLAEGVVWDEALSALWWTDIYAATLWRLLPQSGDLQSWSLPAPLGCFALTQTPGVLLLGLSHGLVRFDTCRQTMTMLAAIRQGPDLRVNDGRCDRAGNFLFGTMVEGGKRQEGRFYRYTPSGQLSLLDLPPAAIPNSLCLSPDGKILYYCDTLEKCIMSCDYDEVNGKVSTSRLFTRLEQGDPDGSTIDAEGYLWNAVWGGGCVTRYTPEGRVAEHIALPARQASCVCFGAEALDTLYVTTASQDGQAHDAAAGLIYAVQGIPARGLPESRFGC